MKKDKPISIADLKQFGAGSAMTENTSSPRPASNERKTIKTPTKLGRHKKETVADRRFNMLFTESDFTSLEENAKQRGLSTAGYVKMLLLEAGAFTSPAI